MFEDSIKLNYQSWEAEILPSFGANVISLKNNGTELLRSPKNIDALKNSPYLYGIPLLFPPNRIEAGRFNFKGKIYHLDLNEPSRNNHIHGLMFNAPFSVKEAGPKHLECVYENNGERYPFEFRMTITCMLNEDGFTQYVDIENISSDDIPVLFAFHTTFAEPETFSVPLKQRLEVNENYIPTGKMLELSEQEREYVYGCCPKGKNISGFFTAKGNTARIGNYFYHTSENFTHWILFNGGGNKGFLCIEPQSGPVNGLNIPDGYINLKKGSKVQFWTRISDK
ncbi:MAG: aldose 1-epimerase [Caldicoprobacterales bacterium]|jgi:aldose 1-epimerase